MSKLNIFLNKLEIGFFYGFLLTWTLSIRKVIFFYPIRGGLNEYLGFYLYFSDLFILGILGIALLSILYNKRFKKSRNTIVFLSYLKQKRVLIPLLLVVFSFFSISWSENKIIALYRSLKLFEFYFLYLWFVFRIVPRETFSLQLGWNKLLKNIFLIIIGTGIVQSIIGIWQFILQKSLGFFWLKESLIGTNLDGVAKIVLNGDKYIRSYGLFPHPNILGGFLFLSIIITIFVKKNCSTPVQMFHPGKNVPPRYKCSTWNILRGRRGTFYGAGVEQFVDKNSNIIIKRWEEFFGRNLGYVIYYLILTIQLIALLLTFSKSAWIALTVALIYLGIKNVPPQHKCSTWNILWGRRGTFYGADVEHFMGKVWKICFKNFGIINKNIKYFALIGGILILLIVIFTPNWYSFLGKSIEDRIFYVNVSPVLFFVQSIIDGNEKGYLGLILGIGMGQSVPFLENIFGIQNWQFQPAHNVFLLILNELGLLGLVLFLWFIWKIIKIVPRGTIREYDYLKAIFFGFLFIMLVDHYFWDIQQGQIFLWIILGLLTGCQSLESKLEENR